MIAFIYSMTESMIRIHGHVVRRCARQLYKLLSLVQNENFNQLTLIMKMFFAVGALVVQIIAHGPKGTVFTLLF